MQESDLANFLFPGLLATSLGAAIAYGMTQPPIENNAPEIMDAAFEMKSQNTVWLLTNTHTDDICLLRKTRSVSVTTSQIDVDPACESVFPESSMVNVWQQDNEGTIVLGDDQGNALAEFSYTTEDGWLSITAEPGGLRLSPSS